MVCVHRVLAVFLAVAWAHEATCAAGEACGEMMLSDSLAELTFSPESQPRGLSFNSALVVESVAKGSTAEKLGMQVGDIIETVNGTPAGSRDSLISALRRQQQFTLGVLQMRPQPGVQPDELFNQLRGKKCFISGGGDLPGGRSPLTVLEAYALCKRNPDCKGITSNTRGTPLLDRTYGWNFKNKFDCTNNDDWFTLASIPSQMADLDALDNWVDDQPPWVAPDLERWRGKANVTFLSDDPPVLQFDGFLSDEESAHYIKVGEPVLTPSTVGGTSYDKRTAIRSSWTGWLDLPEHWGDDVVDGVDQRIHQITNVPRTNAEHSQVLRYRVGERYKEHHDFIPEHKSWPSGPRLATFFMYLSNVNAGGGTYFPRLNLTVQPRKGRAILWWNLNFTALANGEDVYKLQSDPRLFHEALPVEEGEKWSVNKWLHHRDFTTNHKLGRNP